MSVTYCAFQPPEGASRTVEGAESLVFVKDGFVPIAVILPIIWMLFHRMWLPVFGYITVMMIIQIALTAIGLPDEGVALVNILVSLYVGIEAGALRRWSLARKGWEMVDVATGYDRVDCERQVFARWLAPKPSKRPIPVGTQTTTMPDEMVVGLFPNPTLTR